MRLFEATDNTKTFVELRRLFEEVDINKDRHISFLELCTVQFGASWGYLHENITEAAMAAAKAKLETVAGRNAMFERKAKSGGGGGVGGGGAGQAMTNEQRMKAESAMRRKQREAEKELASASAGGTPDRIKQAKAEAEAEERAAKAKEVQEQEAKRSAFRKKQEALFGHK